MLSGPVLHDNPCTQRAVTALITDVPRNCAGCWWRWVRPSWLLIGIDRDCPWHGTTELAGTQVSGPVSVFTSGNCRVEWYPPRLLGTWEVTITNGQDPEDGEGDPDD